MRILSPDHIHVDRDYSVEGNMNKLINSNVNIKSDWCDCKLNEQEQVRKKCFFNFMINEYIGDVAKIFWNI